MTDKIDGIIDQEIGYLAKEIVVPITGIPSNSEERAAIYKWKMELRLSFNKVIEAISPPPSPEIRENIEKYLAITFGQFYLAENKRNFFKEADQIFAFFPDQTDKIAEYKKANQDLQDLLAIANKNVRKLEDAKDQTAREIFAEIEQSPVFRDSALICTDWWKGLKAKWIKE